MLNHDGKRYLRRVKALLPCEGKFRRSVLEQLRFQLDQEPEANYAALEARLGSPEKVAAACAAGMDRRELFHALNLRRRLGALLAAFFLAVVFLLSGTLALIARDVESVPGAKWNFWVMIEGRFREDEVIHSD